jgi:hypothetical protein
MNFFGPDTLLIFVVAFLLFGAKRLPELSRETKHHADRRQRAKGNLLELLSLALLLFGAALWTIRLIK